MTIRLDPARLHAAGVTIIRLGVVVVLTAIGLMKFTAVEAEGIRRLVSNSPLMSWMYSVWSVQGASNVIGVVELVTVALLLTWRIWPRAAATGALLAIGTFLTTLSFMITTPGIVTISDGAPNLSGSGQFLLKDLTLLGASVLLFAESLAAIRRSPRPPASVPAEFQFGVLAPKSRSESK